MIKIVCVIAALIAAAIGASNAHTQTVQFQNCTVSIAELNQQGRFTCPDGSVIGYVNAPDSYGILRPTLAEISGPTQEAQSSTRDTLKGIVIGVVSDEILHRFIFRRDYGYHDSYHGRYGDPYDYGREPWRDHTHRH